MRKVSDCMLSYMDVVQKEDPALPWQNGVSDQ